MKNIKKKVRLLTMGLVTALSLSYSVVSIPPAVAPTAKAEAVTLNTKAATLAKYRNAYKLNDRELIALLHAVGFKGKALRQAWAISKRETHGNPLAHNGNRKTGDNSYGLFQINMIDDLGAKRRQQFKLRSNAELFDPVTNAQIAYYMSKGGKDWSAWKGMTPKAKQWLAKYPK